MHYHRAREVFPSLSTVKLCGCIEAFWPRTDQDFFLLLKHKENLMAMGGGCWKDNAARWLRYTWLSQLFGFRKVRWQPSTLQLKLIRTPKWSEVKWLISLAKVSTEDRHSGHSSIIIHQPNWNEPESNSDDKIEIQLKPTSTNSTAF